MTKIPSENLGSQQWDLKLDSGLPARPIAKVIELLDQNSDGHFDVAELVAEAVLVFKESRKQNR
jgi:hypothetical protein